MAPSVLRPLVAAAVAVCTYLPPASAAPSIKTVIAHVQCDVCKLAMKEARGQARNKSILEEDALTDLADNLCSPKKTEGNWVAKLDITREADGAPLALQRQDKVGHCRSECKAIQQSCAKAISGKEEAIVSLLLDSAGLAKLQNTVCEKPCKKKSLPKLDGWVDEEFEEDKDEALNKLMESMKGMPGMGNMQMFKPGEL
mmetsp:Transcript_104852/g.306220  ORF Transcript_104852/g.306220 Transcript_104852/m.306220 type:complete len:199 (-) Transcript_104852:56-652(-)